MENKAITRRVLSALWLGLGLAGTVSAQAQLYQFNGTKQYDRLGHAVAAAGDVNGDTYPDVIVGAPEDFQIFFADKGFARVYSGFDGSILYTFDGDSIFDQFGGAVGGGGDVNMDGRADPIVGAPFDSNTGSTSGLVRVFNGATGLELYSFDGTQADDQLGFSVANAGDVNGDNRDDIIAGAPFAMVNGNNSAGYARVFSGIDGTVLHTFSGTGGNDRIGFSVAYLGDVTGDSQADLLVGSMFDGVRVYNGANGTVVHNFFSFASDDIYGKAVARLSDITGDGIPEILIGATQESALNPGTGYVQIRNGASGALVRLIDGANYGASVGDLFGNSIGDAGDWDGDGLADVIIGSNPADGGTESYAKVVGSISGNLLFTFTTGIATEDYGWSVAGVGDLDKDGKSDVCIGAPHAAPNGLASGFARVLESPIIGGCTGSTSMYCTSQVTNSNGTKAFISTSGSLSVGTNTFALHVTGAMPNQFGVFYYGDTQVNTPFGSGIRCVDGTFVARLGVQLTDGAGAATRVLDFTGAGNENNIVGPSTWNFQFWYRDPGAGAPNFSDAVEVQFCP